MTETAIARREPDGAPTVAADGGWTPERKALLRRTYATGIRDDEFEVFLAVAIKSGLDPFARQIYAISRGGKMTVQTGIDGYRALAARTGAYAGSDDAIFDDGPGHPTKATVTVYRLVGGLRCPFTATARWSEYCPQNGGMWQKMPHTMLAKCAEGLALRKGFPAELSGLYTDAEMDQADTRHGRTSGADAGNPGRPGPTETSRPASEEPIAVRVTSPVLPRVEHSGPVLPTVPPQVIAAALGTPLPPRPLVTDATLARLQTAGRAKMGDQWPAYVAACAPNADPAQFTEAVAQDILADLRAGRLKPTQTAPANNAAPETPSTATIPPEVAAGRSVTPPAPRPPRTPPAPNVFRRREAASVAWRRTGTAEARGKAALMAAANGPEGARSWWNARYGESAPVTNLSEAFWADLIGAILDGRIDPLKPTPEAVEAVAHAADATEEQARDYLSTPEECEAAGLDDASIPF